MRKAVRAVLIPLVAVAFVQCQQRPTDSAEAPEKGAQEGLQAAVAAPGEAMRVHEAVTLWVEGNTDAALALLLEHKRSGAAPVAPLECLSMNEAQCVRAMNSGKYPDLQNQNMKAGEAIRALGRTVVAEINAARARGEDVKAARWTRELKAMAAQLSGPQYNKLLQLCGQAVEKLVARELR